MFAAVIGITAFSYAEQQRQKIYVLDQGKSLLLALQTDAIMNKELEIKDHVSRFHELMFTLSPQKRQYRKALTGLLTFQTNPLTHILRIWRKRDIMQDWYQPIYPSK